ncbi:MAG: putative metallopeptidase [Armatimonadota bacterium]|nr:putative metallopeptidase [Armatimonadota bacterium]MDR7449551.1 putative metallopeptidase [Armatimonadota bacterium]MDR7460055.1 putative metallopeptidase [Armatimonadota bacterium]MDR7478691.1 putative metallopeptidase [Armatimonadota bacterium]MDR7491849.1 putative metallopeptidase [Armatimonadota bacterium]
MRWQPAPDIHRRLVRIARALGFDHVDPRRVHCLRVFGSRANAYARIWGLPQIFQRALRVRAHYVVEVLMPDFGRLSRAQQDRVLIHELLHIPRTFSGGLRPERAPRFAITHHTVSRLYRQYLTAARGRSAGRRRGDRAAAAGRSRGSAGTGRRGGRGPGVRGAPLRTVSDGR